MATTKTTPTEVKEKVKITVSSILADLSNGIDRKGIREKYNLSASDVTKLFQHEKLKGARVKLAPSFELEDDTAQVEEAPKAKKSKATIQSSAAMSVGESAANSTTVSEVKEEVEEVEQTEEVEDAPKEKQGLW